VVDRADAVTEGMMEMPGADLAVVPTEKVTGYLLSLTHPVGRRKAVFFIGLGFDPGRPEELAAALRSLAAGNPVTETESTAWGTKYAVEGPIPNPAGRFAMVRTIWIVADDGLPPRLVTAYPA
jgi:hypothetical protein